jgi:cation-dependent mannose-6-phosphate receptor
MLCRTILVALAAAAVGVSATQPTTTTTTTTTTSKTAIATPCVATHATSGAFYDLRPDMAVAVKEGEKARKGVPTDDYLYAKPHDWPHNFTMNICAPVVKPVKAEGIETSMAKNISAYYEQGGKIYSLGYVLDRWAAERGKTLADPQMSCWLT